MRYLFALKLLLIISCGAVSATLLTEHDYAEIITKIEEEKGQYAKELIDPNINLARIYAETGRFDMAEESLRKAQHYSHRNDGVYTMRQLEIIDLLFNLNLATGKIDHAEKQQVFSLLVSQHNIAEDSPDLLPALLKRARWQFESGQYQDSRQTLDGAREIIVTHFGENDPRLVEVLKLEARTRQLQGLCCAEKPLKQALKIIEAHPELNDEYSFILFSLGDAYLISRKPGLAQHMYHQAIVHQKSTTPDEEIGSEIAPKPIPMYREITRHSPHKRIFKPRQNSFESSRPYQRALMDRPNLEEVDEFAFFVIPYDDHQYDIRMPEGRQRQTGNGSIRQLIGEPIQFELGYLQTNLPSSYTSEGKLNEVFIHLNLSVMANGRATNLEITESNAPAKLNQLLKRVLAQSRFRPRLMDGKAVDTDNIEFVQTFMPYMGMFPSQARSE